MALFPSSPIWSRQPPVPSLLHFGILTTACGRWHHSWQLSLPLSFVVSGPINIQITIFSLSEASASYMSLWWGRGVTVKREELSHTNGRREDRQEARRETF